jgi:outer membrane lipoprotein-sorting protein
MKAAYVQVADYQTKVEVRTRTSNGSFEVKKFLYTFKKPNRIRLDFERPRPGMVVIYPDENGKAVIRPSGLARFLRFRLSPSNSLLTDSSGQRIYQTDLGLLIRNISHSLTGWRRGDVEITEDGGNIRVRVPAENHFHKGVVTQYQFLIDRELWLPIKVQEETVDGILERTVIFGNLRINVGVQDSNFQLDGR